MKRSFFFLSVLSFSFFYLPAQVNTRDDKISLEEIWLTPFYFPQFGPEFRWMNDDSYYSVLENQKILKYSIEDEGKVGTILEIDEILLGDAANVESYDFSSDEKRMLLYASSEQIYRRSSREQVYVANLDPGEIRLIHEGAKVSNAEFSPDGSKVAYVFENNLYYYDWNSKETVQVTDDGEINAVINGATDWVYEEEFAFTRAFSWSPDNQHLAYIRFDEREVPQWTMTMYGDLYPELYQFKYPKAGEKNSSVSVHIYDLEAGETQMADLGEDKDIYIARMTWANEQRLAMMHLNRLQNRLTLLQYDTEDKKTHTILTEVSDTYVREATDDKWHFLSEDKGFLWLSEIDGYQHIYHKASDGSAIAQLTKGEFEVEEILGVDEENELIYFLSTEVSPFERHLYSINFKGKKKKKLTDTAGKHSITVSSALNYFVDSYSTQTKPGVTRLVNNKGESLKTLVDNATLEQRLSKLDIKAPEFFSFTTTEDIDLNGWMIKPTSFDPAKKYPVLMFVYGGPRSQEVLNEWGSFNYLWYQMLAQQGYIIACVDGRGTGARGRDFATVTYGELGKYETIDQIETAKYLGQQSYVDADRIGIWGWSYGGYMTALCMTKGNGIFKAGISVAPVTNWRFYDTIYTERYLKTPQLNPSGYDQNSPINFANQLQGKMLLVHGTGDDNVHVQNSMEMINALVASNKQFDLFFYPNRNHGIYGGYTRYHLYKKMTDFVLENL